MASIVNNNNATLPTLPALEEEIADLHKKISQLQNQIDTMNYTFQPKDLQGGWDKVFACKDAMIISLDSNITLSEDGKKVLKVVGKSISAANLALASANFFISQRYRHLQNEMRSLESQRNFLEEQVRQKNIVEKPPFENVCPKIQQQKSDASFYKRIYYSIHKIFSLIYRFITLQWYRK